MTRERKEKGNDNNKTEERGKMAKQYRREDRH